MKKILIALFLLASMFHARATQVSIIAKNYVGQELTLTQNKNFLLSIGNKIASGVVLETGSIQFELDLKETTKINLKFDIFEGWFFAEPNKKYEFVLPDPTHESTHSAFFKPTLIHLFPSGKDSTELNLLTERFLTTYYSELDQTISEIVYRQSATLAKQTIQNIEQKYTGNYASFFESFKQLKYASIEIMAGQQAKERIIEKVIKETPIMYNREDYGEFFRQLFNAYIPNEIPYNQLEELTASIHSGSLNTILQILEKNLKLKRKYAEAVLLANLESLFFSQKYDPNGILKLLTEIEKTSSIQEHIQLLKELKTRFKLHLPGAVAPTLNTVDLNGNRYDWGSFYGKYIYLYFANNDTTTFRRNLDLLNTIHTKFNKKLEIAIVLSTKDLPQFQGLLNQTQNRFSVLLQNSSLIKDFDIQHFPTYYLIHPSGKIVWFQTPWPEENFMERFYNLTATNK